MLENGMMEKDLYREMYEAENSYWWFTARRRIILTLIDKYLPISSPPRFLDIGCGTGSMLRALEDHGEAVGMDVSEEALSFAAARTKATLLKGRAPEDLGSLEGKFHCVLMLDLLEHVEDDREVVNSAARLLEDQGILIITVPAHPWLYAPRDEYHHHLRRYKKGEVRKLVVSAGLREIFTSYYNTSLFPFAVIQRLWSRFRKMGAGPDIRMPPVVLNRLLDVIFGLERFLLGRISLPWGLSIISVARKA